MAIRNYTVTTTTTTFYQSSGETVVTPVYLYNNTASTVVANVFLVDNHLGTGVASPSTQIYGNLQIAGYDTFVVDREKMILDNNDFIAANCSTANAVTLTVSYSSV